MRTSKLITENNSININVQDLTTFEDDRKHS